MTSAYSILGDPALYKVVQTVFDFPDAMSSADIDKQAAALTKRLDLSTLKDPAKLQTFVERFTDMWDITQDTTPSPIISLFDSSSQPTLGDDLIATLNSLKHGGS